LWGVRVGRRLMTRWGGCITTSWSNIYFSWGYWHDDKNGCCDSL